MAILRHLTPLSLSPHPNKLFKTLTRTRFPLSSPTFSVSAMASSATRKVLVPIAKGTEPMEAVITIDVLRRAGADVTVASVEKDLRVDAAWGVTLVADALISDCTDNTFDLISLPGGMPGSSTLRDCGALEKLVKKQVEDGRVYAAICAAPAVALGSWGLLKGLKATCYPSFMDQLASSGANTVESRVQEDGKVVTSRGPGTAMEYAVALVEKLFGKEKADEVAGPLLLPSNHGDDYTIAEFNPVKWQFNKTLQLLGYKYVACLNWIEAFKDFTWEAKIAEKIAKRILLRLPHALLTVLVPIAHGSEEMEAIMIIDILRRAKANVVVASVENGYEIVASRKVKILADMLLEDASKLTYDLIVLPGGIPGAQTFSKSENLVNMLKKQMESDKPYAAICASPALVLEPHGLLKGKKATSFPALCDKLSDKSEVENRIVVDGLVITSRGPGTSMEFSLAIVEKFFGRETALELAKTMVFARP